jgi:C4-dicarboxylate transporter DctM subunit
MGYITPPFGVNLFVACQLAKIKMEEMTRYILLYVAVLLANLAVISCFPALSLWLPNVLR